MGGRMRRTLVFLLALLCALTSALGEETKNAGIAWTAEVRLTDAPDMGKEAMAAMNTLLSRLRFTIRAGKSCGRIAVAADGEEIVSAEVTEGDEYTLTLFGPAGNAYLTSPGEKDALGLLTGGGMTLPPLTEWAEKYPVLAEKLYGVLEQNCNPKRTKQKTSIKNTAGSTVFITYTLSGNTLTDGVWEEALEAILPALREILGDREDLYESARQVMEELMFSGECTFKRFLDKDGGDMGMQFTGTVAWRREKRKVTLFCGYTPGKGGYLSLRLPAARGDNETRIMLDYAETTQETYRSWTLNADYINVYDGEKQADHLEGTVKNTHREAGEEWTGRIQVSKTENKRRTEWTLTPQLSGDGKDLAGTVRFSRQVGKNDPMKGEITLRIGYEADMTMPETPKDAVDLRAMPEEEARSAVRAEWIPLTGAVARLVQTLTEEERALVTHALRTDEWMYGPDAPVFSEDGAWTVKEDGTE